MDVNTDPLPQCSTPPGSGPNLSLQTTPEDEFPGSEGGSSRGSSERGTPVKNRRASRLSDSFQDNASTCSSTSSVTSCTTTSKGSTSTKLPLRPGITWKKGEKVEAMDFMNKWYPAKIADMDEEEQMVMIHFDGWNSRYDEWVPMTSEKLRPKTRHSHRKGKSKFGVFKVGDHVYAKWTDCKMYPGKITNIPTDGAYEVLFYDGFKKVVQGINIKPMPGDIKNQKIEIIHVLPKDEKKKYSDGEVSGKRRSSSVYSRRSVDEAEKNEMVTPKTKALKDSTRRRGSNSGERNKDKKTSNVSGLIKGEETQAVDMKPAVMKESGTEPDTMNVGDISQVQQQTTQEDSKIMLEVSAEQPSEDPPPQPDTDVSVSGTQETVDALPQPEINTSMPVSPASTLSATTTPPMTPKLSPLQKIEAAIPTTVLPAFTDIEKSTPVSKPGKRSKKGVSSPGVLDGTQADQSNRRRSKSSEKREVTGASMDNASARKRSRSAAERGIGNYILVPETEPPPKAFVVEQEHNHFKCQHEGCNKGFRKESLLDYHVKYYHSNEGKPVQAPPRKRRKTSSICSTDSDTSSVAKQRSRSLSGNHSKQKYLSAESPISVVDTPSDHIEVALTSGNTNNLSSLKAEVELQRQRTISQNTMVTEEEIMETDAEDTLSKDEVVNCICGFYEENGLMIQCDVCLCWQHAACFEITEATLPKKYVCFVCENPPGVRDSCKYIHEQDWLRNGHLAHFKFLANQEVDQNRCRTVQATHGLVADMLNITTVLSSLRHKYKIAREKDHTNPELRNWIQNLDLIEMEDEDDEEEEDEEEDTSGMEDDKKGSMEEDTDLNVSDTAEISCQATVENVTGVHLQNVAKTECSDTNTSGTNSPTVSKSETNSPTASKSETKNVTLAEPGKDSMQSTEIKSEAVNSEVGMETAPSVSKTNSETKADDSTKGDMKLNHVKVGQSEKEKDERFIREDDNSDTLSADSIRYESETGGDDSHDATPSIGPSGDNAESQKRKDMEKVSVIMGDPFKNCERNLLEHILRIQSEIEKRFDMIEEQVLALETADGATINPRQEIPADIPALKKCLYMLQNDLEKVKLMSSYNR